MFTSSLKATYVLVDLTTRLTQGISMMLLYTWLTMLCKRIQRLMASTRKVINWASKRFKTISTSGIPRHKSPSKITWFPRWKISWWRLSTPWENRSTSIDASNASNYSGTTSSLTRTSTNGWSKLIPTRASRSQAVFWKLTCPGWLKICYNWLSIKSSQRLLWGNTNQKILLGWGLL